MEIATIQSKIYEIRGQRVMLDSDLAALYQVETRVLNQAVKRNSSRFEGVDFMFQFTNQEFTNLKSQIVTSSWGGSRKMPYAFTEIGVSMLSSVLRSETAIMVNRAIMRAFVEMRNYLTSTATITAELDELRTKLQLLERNDEDNMAAMNDLSEDVRKDIENIYKAIAALSVKLPTSEKPRNKIVYRTE